MKFSPRLHACALEILEARIAPAALSVTSLADSGTGSLRDAILAANAAPGADVITFKTGGAIKLLSSLPEITDDLDLMAAKGVTLDGKSKFQILSITGTDLAVKIEGLTFTHGLATLGGALSIDDEGGTVALKKTTFTANIATASDLETEAEAGGGAIANLKGTLSIESSTFTSNKASSSGTAEGGAIFNQGVLTISGTTFSKNTTIAPASVGGAIFNATGASATLTGATLSGNSAHGAAGAKGVDGSPDGDLEGQTGLDGGTANGGAIFNGGELTIRTSKITGNSALGGVGGAGGRGAKGTPAHPAEYDYGTPGYNGGSGGNGGAAYGGAIANVGGGAAPDGVLTISGTALSKNKVSVGKGGTGGAGGAAAKGVPGGGAGFHGTVGALGAGGGDQ